MTAGEYSTAAGNKLPRGFVEEERRRMWRRKQDEDIATVTAQRDALLAATQSLLRAWGSGYQPGESSSIDAARAAVAKVSA